MDGPGEREDGGKEESAGGQTTQEDWKSKETAPLSKGLVEVLKGDKWELKRQAQIQ